MIKCINKIVPVFLCLITITIAQKNNNKLQGTWCVGEDGLVLTFKGKDTLKVASLSDESVSGTGIYEKNDSAFTATVLNGDVEMKMRYRYQWIGNDTVKAKAEFFTINGDSVSFPEEWMAMTRCDFKEMQPKESGEAKEKNGKD